MSSFNAFHEIKLNRQKIWCTLEVLFAQKESHPESHIMIFELATA